ncbi:HAMP domain-containing histidine kinase [Paenibacillus sp. IB182496]|uniref:histidine kinase n=1 Tax=Paenibacillus sabuli TaxID=2772509 RepID=A0A927BRP4_9BACL|nr:HAMP domain-containing sensor histidine kinase [Paenibacillus sabuli]MBD2845533.1 HAMP domain-containing histidine kinase [Paenibacillus sabuli]
MRLRTYLLLANCISIAFIIILLLVFFRFMLVTREQLIWLGAATVSAGIVSAALHFLLVRPLEASVRRMRRGAARVASGELTARVADAGLAEFRELAGQFNTMAANLERSFAQVVAGEQAQRQLVANIAHDLRTPLASLQAYAEALEDGVVTDEDAVRRYVGTIRAETIRLGELIQDVFDLSTLDAADAEAGPHGSHGPGDGARTGDPVSTVVEDLLVELLPRFAPQLAAKSLQLQASAPERPLAVQMPERSLVRVLQNLLENAIRHSPAGGRITIETQAASARQIRIAVIDEGPGVTPEERDRIFERFYRIDRSRSRDGGGAGLGLSIARLLVEQHGGEIGVEAAPGGGARFWFSLAAADGIESGRSS